MAEPQGLFTEIVVTLRRHGNSLPADYLAVALGRRPGSIDSDLKRLEEAGVVERVENVVRLLQT